MKCYVASKGVHLQGAHLASGRLMGWPSSLVYSITLLPRGSVMVISGTVGGRSQLAD